MKTVSVLAALLLLFITPLSADEFLPRDNGLATYYTQPRYRASDEHPLRFAAYILHPVGWVLREAIVRPVNYLISSTEESRSIFGYREHMDYFDPDCFSKGSASPDCRSILPYNYERGTYSAIGKNSQPIYFPNVNFDFNSSNLNERGLARINEVSSTLDQYKDIVVVLEGHTDYIGSDGYNNTLGLKRAETVRNSLIEIGVDASRLSTVTFGESKPLNADKSDAARAENRRVEVHQE